MSGHVGADQRRVMLAARIEAALMIAHAGFSLFRLGVSQQHQAHGTSIDFSRAVWCPDSEVRTALRTFDANFGSRTLAIS
jgi:hypothetical protein